MITIRHKIFSWLALLIFGSSIFLPQYPAKAGTDDFDLGQADIVNAPGDVASWPATATITNVDVRDFIQVDFDKRTGDNRWADQCDLPGFAPDCLQYTLWLFLKINNKWVGSGFVQFWYGRELTAASKILYLPCDYYYSNRWGAMFGHQIMKGEQIGFMVTAGNARNVGNTDIKERSNVVLVTSPVSSVSNANCPSGPGGPPAPTPTPVPTGPVIYSLNLLTAVPGQNLIVYGANLSSTVQFYINGQRYTEAGTVNAEKTRTNISIPDIPPGDYTVKIWVSNTSISNGKPLTIKATSPPSGDNLPPPNHPMFFGYYHVNAQYGDYFNEVSSFTNSEVILQESFLRADLHETDKLKAALKQAADAGKAIIYAPSQSYANGLKEGLDAARDYWNKIAFIYLADEPSWNKQRVESEINNFKASVTAAGLAEKPIAINFTNDQILNSDAFQADNLDIVGTEAYLDSSDQNSNVVSKLNDLMARVKARLNGRKMFWVMQAYNRNGTWTNTASLTSIQTPVYLNTYNDPSVAGILMFSYARSGGARSLPTLKAEHQKIGAAILGANVAPSGLICDPLPDDPDQLLECNYWDIINPQPPTYPPGTNPSSPVKVPLMGWFGISGAYSESKDKILLVTADPGVGTKQSTVRGVMVDAKSYAVEKGPFVIDQGSSESFAGSPLAVFDPDKKRFLVIWGDTRGSGSNPYVYGRILDADGTVQGSDFKIGNLFAFVISSLEYDKRNKTFVFMDEQGGNRNVIATLDNDGKLTKETVLPVRGEYAGQAGVTVNTNLNQYWAATMDCTGDNKPQDEDCRDYLYKFDIATGNRIGDGITLNTPMKGHNFFGGGKIRYSSQDGRALAFWIEAWRGAIYGASIADDGSITGPFALMDSGVDPYFFGPGSGGPIVMNYNPWTNTFMLSTGIGSGESMLFEYDSTGFLLQEYDALGLPVAALKSKLQRWLSMFIKTASATAFGNFNSTNVVTPFGALALSSQNYTQLVFTAQSSAYSSTTSTSTNPPGTIPLTNPDLSGLAALIGRIYVWAIGVAALLALLMTIMGGYYRMTASGNAEQAGKGTEMIWASVIGLALLFGAYLILNTINPDLVNFKFGTYTPASPSSATSASSSVRN